MPFQGQSPLHGNQGDREPDSPPYEPEGFAVAVSRQVGARGTSIAQRVKKKWGGHVYTRELLEYLATQDNERNQLIQQTSPANLHWVDQQILRLRQEKQVNSELLKGHLPRLMLILSTAGKSIFVGGGAGFILPRQRSLHVRLYGPQEDRRQHLCQWLRLTPDEAEQQLRKREERRLDYLMTHFRNLVDEETCYDLFVNATTLGEDASAEIIATAAKSKERGQPSYSEMAN